MKTDSSRETLKALLADNGPLDIEVIPTPERREKLTHFLAEEKEKFVAIARVHGKNNERDLSR
jgi:dsDNA-binding SOS-regulon protein